MTRPEKQAGPCPGLRSLDDLGSATTPRAQRTFRVRSEGGAVILPGLLLTGTILGAYSVPGTMLDMFIQLAR